MHLHAKAVYTAVSGEVYREVYHYSLYSGF